MYLNLSGLASFVALVTTTLAHAELPPRVGLELGGGLQVESLLDVVDDARSLPPPSSGTSTG